MPHLVSDWKFWLSHYRACTLFCTYISPKIIIKCVTSTLHISMFFSHISHGNHLMREKIGIYWTHIYRCITPMCVQYTFLFFLHINVWQDPNLNNSNTATFLIPTFLRPYKNFKNLEFNRYVHDDKSIHCPFIRLLILCHYFFFFSGCVTGWHLGPGIYLWLTHLQPPARYTVPSHIIG